MRVADPDAGTSYHPQHGAISMMRVLTVAILTLLSATAAVHAQAPAPQAAGEPKTTWFFYTVRWGFQDEFLDLFQRNHYPILKEMERTGRYLSVKTFVPENHGDGRADWTFAVELVEPAKPPAAPTEEEIVAKLYPDRAKLRKEEQRRFELLVAHWDVPLNRIDLSTRKAQ
jgi:hypothetical protein